VARHLYVFRHATQLIDQSEEGAFDKMATYTPLGYPTRRETVRNLIAPRRELIILVLLSIMIRIPRVSGVIGDDAFVVLWMGRILSEGYFENWTLSPFSLFGLYPFASYPIGIPLVVAIMLRLGLSFEIIVFVVSTTAGVVGTAGAYSLGRELFGTDRRPLFFTLFYSFSSVFVNFTYFTITPRGLFLAVLPWFLFYSVKFMRGRNVRYWKLTSEGLMLVPEATVRDLVIASMLLAVLFFIHGLAVFILAYAAVVVGYYLLRWLLYNRISVWVTSTFSRTQLTTKTKFSYTVSDHVSLGGLRGLGRRVKKLIPQSWPLWLAYLILVGGAFVLGIIFVPIDPAKTSEFLFSNNTLFGKSWNLIVDYGIRLGLLSVFLPVGMLGAVQEDLGSSKKLIHFILVPLVMFILPLSLYTSVLFLPVFGYYSVVGFDLVRNSIKERWIGFLSVGFMTVFLVVYIQYAAVLPVWTIGFVVAAVVITIVIVLLAFRMWSTYHTIVGRQLRSWRTSIGQGPVNFLDWQGIRIFLISVIIISLISTEGILLQGDYKYVTNDERQIIEYLGEQSAAGIVFVPTPVLGRRLEAYGFKAVLSFNNDATLYFGWIESSNITANSHFSISNLILSGRLFYYSGPDVERIIWNQLFNLDLTSTTNREFALALELEYVIVEKTPSGYSDIFYSIYGDYVSTLLHSAPLACNRVVDGERLSLFHIPT
jgi:hypothetical protein